MKRTIEIVLLLIAFISSVALLTFIIKIIYLYLGHDISTKDALEILFYLEVAAVAFLGMVK